MARTKEQREKLIAKAKKLRDEGCSSAIIGRKLGVNPSTVRCWLCPDYTARQIARIRAWYKANTERQKATCKAYYEANRERMNAAAKAWREANPERHKALTRAWREANPERVNESRQRASKIRVSHIALSHRYQLEQLISDVLDNNKITKRNHTMSFTALQKQNIVELRKIVKDYDDITSENDLNVLCKGLYACINETLPHYARLCVFVGQIRKQGGKLPARFKQFLAVAEGRMSVKTVFYFREQPTVRDAISKLPLKVQEQLVGEKPLTVAAVVGGTIKPVKKTAYDINGEEAKRVFSGPAIRSFAAQAKLLKVERRRESKPWRIDRGSRKLIVTRSCEISLDVLVKAIGSRKLRAVA